MNTPAQPVKLSKAVFLYIVVAFFLFLEMGFQVLPSVLTSQLMQSLQVGTFGLGLISSVYFYSYTAMQIPSGMLFDRFNPRYVIFTAILVCVIGMLFFVFAHSITGVVISRFVIGLGSAFAFVSVLVVTADLFPPRYFALMTGITQMLAALGAMAGQMPISLLVSYIGWRQSVLLLTVIAFILAIIVLLTLRYRRQYQVMDQCLRDCKPSRGVSAILKNPQTWFVALYACLLWAPMSGFASLWGVPYLQHVDGLSKDSAALYCSMMWLGLAIGSPILGWFVSCTGKMRFTLYFTALVGAIAFYMIIAHHLPAVALVIFLLLAGAACAGQALSFAVVKDNNGEYNKGAAIAINNMAVVISGAIFQPIIGHLIEKFSMQLSLASSYRAALMVILGVYIVAFILARFFIKAK